MNYAGIRYDDIANGEGIRTTLYVSGCTHKCPDCFSKQTWNFNYGEKFTEEIRDKIIDSVEEKYYQGITIMGGDPLEDENCDAVLDLILKFRERYSDTKDIWLYTGWRLEDLLKQKVDEVHDSLHAQILMNIDVLVDGPFVKELSDKRLLFRGSSNQKIYHINTDREKHQIILVESLLNNKPEKPRPIKVEFR